MQIALAIFLGGGLGSLARYGIGRASKSLWTSDFPVGTLIANILATALLAITVYMLKDKITETGFLKPFLVIGFCGGFSTFSTFSFETMELIRNSHHALAIANIAISVLVCVALVWVIAKAA